VALGNPEIWVVDPGAIFPDGDACAFLTGFRRTSSPAGTTRVVFSRNWNGSVQGMVFYENNSADQMAAVWFIDSGATFDITNLASRPAIGTACNGYLAMRSTGEVRAGWATIAAPTVWTVGETGTGIGAHGANNAMSLTSNANGALMEAQRWAGWNGFKPETDFNGETYNRIINNTADRIFEIPLNDSDITSPWPDISGNGNDATQQGGTAPTNVANFLQNPPPPGQNYAVDRPPLESMDEALGGFAMLNVADWITVRGIEKWVSDELDASSGANFTHSGEGGIAFGGTATAAEANDYAMTGSGGLTFAGDATELEANDYTHTPSGGLTFSGDATEAEANDYTHTPSGGIVFAGDADETNAVEFTHTASGGLTIGGAAVYEADYIFAADGGIVFGGDATEEGPDLSHVATGGIVFAGSATAIEANDYVMTGAGGIVFGGAASVESSEGGAPGDAAMPILRRRRGR
jgi:hypothetical protein